MADWRIQGSLCSRLVRKTDFIGVQSFPSSKHEKCWEFLKFMLLFFPSFLWWCSNTFWCNFFDRNWWCFYIVIVLCCCSFVRILLFSILLILSDGFEQPQWFLVCLHKLLRCVPELNWPFVSFFLPPFSQGTSTGCLFRWTLKGGCTCLEGCIAERFGECCHHSSQILKACHDHEMYLISFLMHED